jgi:tetratricopeptide (TPR) repeat protein
LLAIFNVKPSRRLALALKQAGFQAGGPDGLRSPLDGAEVRAGVVAREASARRHHLPNRIGLPVSGTWWHNRARHRNPPHCHALCDLGAQDPRAMPPSINPIRLTPMHDTSLAEAIKNHGNQAFAAGDLASAEALYREAIGVAPDYMPAHNNLGNALTMQGHYADALAAYERAAQLAPGDHEIHDNIGMTLSSLTRFDEAIRAFDRALALTPNAVSARVNRAFAYLHLERWTEGFADYEYRLALPECETPPGLRASGAPHWDGRRLDGRTLLVYHEQGMGDMIQFLRYATLCRASGARVMAACTQPLARLLEACEDVQWIAVDGAPLPVPFDAYVSVMSLPALFGRRPDLPPLKINVAPGRHPAILGAPGLKVGVCWRGNPKQGRNNIRSVPTLDFWSRLGGTSGVSFFNLQVDEDRSLEGAVALAPDITDYHDTAALVGQLDVVVTVCTSIAHLAGSLGVPTMLILAFSPDWRWGSKGDRTPWYPSIRIHRQPSPGDWESPLREVRSELEMLSATVDPR